MTKRKQISITIALFSALCIFALQAAEQNSATTAVDNEHIHTFRGRLGRWVQPQGDSIQTLAKRYQTTAADILRLNHNEFPQSRIFVPYGENYLAGVLKQGLGRRLYEMDDRKFVWPVEQPNYTSRFGLRWAGMHDGLDMACANGTVVVAAKEGQVIVSTWYGGLGLAVAIKHPDGLVTWYGHNSELLLKEGETVERGQIIAFSGTTGYSTGPHVHFEVRYENIALNPEDFLQFGLVNPEVAMREVPPMEQIVAENSAGNADKARKQ